MRSNSALATEAAELASSQNLDGYTEGVAKHINGDWSEHYQMLLINTGSTTNPSYPLWKDTCGDTIPGSRRLRLPITLASGITIYVVVPVIDITNVVVHGSSAPVIITQPANASCNKGGTVSLSIVAGGFPLTYQWTKNGHILPGAVSQILVITKASLSDSGDYTCLISNTTGSVLSSIAKLTVVVKNIIVLR